MNVSSQIARRDFSAKTLRTLAKRGIEIVGVQMLPGTGDLPWADPERGYLICQNDTGKVRTFRQVLDLAA